MNISIRLTFKGEPRDTRLQLFRDNKGDLYLRPDNGHKDISLILDGSSVISTDYTLFEESKADIDEVLSEMLEKLVEVDSSGLELTLEEDDDKEEPDSNYSPRDIYVENKPFSIRQLMLLIEDGDLELNPDFQRNFIWNRTRQSLLIESILLGLPIPSIYLSQYDDGRLTVVDGLQRLTTIQKFLDNKLKLNNLEYLTDCNGKTFGQIKTILPKLQIRQFSQAQIGCFVIDYRSPERLKFDLFRRLNTGAKPLNRPEIRNCLSRPHVQRALKEMWNSEEFLSATNSTVGNSRMQAADLVTRYLFFKEEYTPQNPIGDYNGKIEPSLDNFTAILNRRKDFSAEIKMFREAMRSSEYLFGKDAFRKQSMSGSNRRLAVNQLLFIVFAVLLSQVSYERVCATFPRESLTASLYKLIESNADLDKALTTGTNARWNITVAFQIIRDNLLAPLFS